MEVSSEDETLIEVREVEMVPPCGGKPTRRVAHFLKPSLPISQEPALNSRTLFNFKLTKPSTPNSKSLSSKIHFYGSRRSPQTKWNSWVEKLRPSFEPIWKKSSIFEPIMCSTLQIPKCNDTIFALAQRWCPETNSFLLPWGEVTVTLEDILVLGGYSVTGDSVLSENKSKELLEIEAKLLNECLKIARSTRKKSSHSPWMDVWMENGSEFEHEAFLSLWLSRYVLSADSFDAINKNVFPIAVRLARGTKIALAPAVLASIYRDLRLLKAYVETFGDHDDGNATKVKLWAPLQLLQVWIWERFPTLSPEPKAITHGLSRLARWNKAKISREVDVGLAIDSAKESFRWRPYSTCLNNWSCCAKLYPEKARWVPVGCESDLDLQSHARCIRVSELVGLDSFQQYLPHRVAMQFGFDQDIPLDVPRRNGTHEIAWSYHNRPIRDAKLYVPSRLFESDVTTRYLQWWKSNFEKQSLSRVSMEDAMPTSSVKMEEPPANHFQCSLKGSLKLAERMRIKIENNEVNVPPGFESLDPTRKREVVTVSFDQPSLKRYKVSPNDPEIRLGSNKANVPCCLSSSQVKGVESEDDSDADHLTLSQLFKRKHAKRLTTPDSRGATPPCHSESSLCSGGENASVRDSKSATIPWPMSSNEKELGRGLEDVKQSAEVNLEPQASWPKSTELDLEARLSRLRRIVGYLLPFMQNAKN